MATISVNYDFTPCQPGITMRTSDDKFACWINKKFIIAAKQFLNSCRQCFFNSWHQDFLKIFTYLLLHGFFSDKFSFMRFVFWQNKFIMLSADNYRVDPKRFVIVIIF